MCYTERGRGESEWWLPTLSQFSLALPPSLCLYSEWGDECVCLSQFLLIVWSKAGGVKARERWNLSLSLSSLLSHTHTELKQTLLESPDVAEVLYRWGVGEQKAEENRGRGRRQSQQQSFKQHTDGFTTHTIKQTTHRASQHGGVKDWTCKVELHRQTHWHIGAQTHTPLNTELTGSTLSAHCDNRVHQVWVLIHLRHEV